MVSELQESAEAANDLILEEIQEERANSKWTSHLAFSTMVMAMVAAVGALLAGITANQAMIQSTSELLVASKLSEDELTI